jgi:hypothetical protein
MKKVVCINNKNKPKQVAPAEWIIAGKEYTVVGEKAMNLQNGKIGYLLKEVQLSELSFPYELYDSERFISAEEYALQNVNAEELELSI